MDHRFRGQIQEHHFRSHFGRDHEFRVDQRVMLGGHRGFQFGGVSFGINEPWPMGWLGTDAMYVDTISGAYFLCNRAHPGIRIPVNVEDCTVCGPAPATAATCDSCTPAPMLGPNPASCTDCASSGNLDGVTTLSRGQTIAEVVSILGAPPRAIDLGAKQIYLYQNMKVTFLYGRMSEVI